MPRRIERRPQATTDIDDIADRIAIDQLDAAIRFIHQVERAVNNLAENPWIGRERSEILPGLRSWPIHGFTNFILFYFVTDQTVEVVRVLHGAQDLPRHFKP